MAGLPRRPAGSTACRHCGPDDPGVELETRAVLKRCVTARAVLGELKQAAALIPNPGMLINTLPVLEARASSEIENVVTSADALFEYAAREHAADPATKEALRHRHALLEGFQRLDRHRRTASRWEPLFVLQRLHRIQPQDPPSRQHACGERDEPQHQRHPHERERVVGAEPQKQACQ